MSGRHGYDSQETTRRFWRRIVRRSPALNTLAQGIRRMAASAQSDQPVEAVLAQRMEATAQLLAHAAQRAEALGVVARNTMRAENERHEAPRKGSRRVEAKADAGHIVRGS